MCILCDMDLQIHVCCKSATCVAARTIQDTIKQVQLSFSFLQTQWTVQKCTKANCLQNTYHVLLSLIFSVVTQK